MLYTAYNFNYFSPAGILANIPVVFLISLYVPAGMCCFIFFAAGELMLPSGGFLPKAADAVISGLSGAVLHTNDLFYLDGNFVTDVASPPLWLMIALYCGLYFAVSEHASVLALRKEKRRVVAWILAICIGAAACGICSVTPFDRAEAVMTDVGQGDCLHLKWPENTDILIDGGGKADYNVGEKTLKPYLLRNGITDIDLALATHLHTDHYKGIRELSECFDVKREEALKEAAKYTLEVSKYEKLEKGVKYAEYIVGGKKKIYSVYYLADDEYELSARELPDEDDQIVCNEVYRTNGSMYEVFVEATDEKEAEMKGAECIAKFIEDKRQEVSRQIDELSDIKGEMGEMAAWLRR